MRNACSRRSAGRKRLEREAWRAAEDPVVRDERKPQADRSGGDPAVGGVRLLGESMAGGFAVGPKLCIHGYELGAAVDDLNSLDLRLQPEHSGVAPPSTDCAIPQLSDRLERDNAGRPVMSDA